MLPASATWSTPAWSSSPVWRHDTSPPERKITVTVTHYIGSIYDYSNCYGLVKNQSLTHS